MLCNISKNSAILGAYQWKMDLESENLLPHPLGSPRVYILAASPSRKAPITSSALKGLKSFGETVLTPCFPSVHHLPAQPNHLPIPKPALLHPLPAKNLGFEMVSTGAHLCFLFFSPMGASPSYSSMFAILCTTTST